MIPTWNDIQSGILLWIKNHKDNTNKILERSTVKVAFKTLIKYFKSKNLTSENIGNPETHKIFAAKIDKFLRSQINPPDSLIKIEQKYIHDNSFFKSLFQTISKIKISKSDPKIITFAKIISSTPKEEDACLLWIQLISFTRANELYQIISDYL